MGLLAALLLLGGLFQEQAQHPPSSPDKQLAVNPPVPAASTPRTLRIPRVERPPKLEEFETMEPSRHDLVKVTGFIQHSPTDGSPATQSTDVYMGYDHQNLYVVWVCFDREPGKIRAHRSRRENIFDDDYGEITLDTFHDQRHGLVSAPTRWASRQMGCGRKTATAMIPPGTRCGIPPASSLGAAMWCSSPFPSAACVSAAEKLVPPGVSRWRAISRAPMKAITGRASAAAFRDCSTRKQR